MCANMSGVEVVRETERGRRGGNVPTRRGTQRGWGRDEPTDGEEGDLCKSTQDGRGPVVGDEDVEGRTRSPGIRPQDGTETGSVDT